MQQRGPLPARRSKPRDAPEDPPSPFHLSENIPGVRAAGPRGQSPLSFLRTEPRFCPLADRATPPALPGRGPGLRSFSFPAAQPFSRSRAAARAASVTSAPAIIRAISSTRSASASAATREVVIPSSTDFATRK